MKPVEDWSAFMEEARRARSMEILETLGIQPDQQE